MKKLELICWEWNLGHLSLASAMVAGRSLTIALATSAGLLPPSVAAASGIAENKVADKTTALTISPAVVSQTSLAESAAEPAGSLPAENAVDKISVSVDSQLPAETSPATAPLTAVVSVQELSDVSPSDWAFTAVQRLIEDYGCLEGYPDETFRGNRAVTRFEFAALLSACLDTIAQLLGSSQPTADDLATIQRLQDSFRDELAALDARVATLEADTATLEANQFSTTTRLRGEAVFSLEQLFGDERPNGGDLPTELAFGSRVRLNFDTSFTGQDLLKIRLDGLSPVRLNAPVTGTNMTRLAFDRANNNSLDIGKLFYRFPVSARLGFHIDATRGAYQANVSSTFNPGFASPILGAVSRFGRFNPIYYQGALGTGITGVYDLSDNLTFSAGYLARGGASDPSTGLFGGGYTALAQVDYRPSNAVGLGLTYARSYYPSGEVAVAAGTGSRLANAPFGNNTATSADHLGLQSTIRLAPGATLSGWAGLSFANAEATGGTAQAGDDATLLNWAVTLGLPNLGRRGNFGGLVVGQPYRVLSNSGGPDEDDSAWHLEGFYRYQVNPNLSLIPGVIVLLNPENNSANDSIVVGSFRTVFRF
ncbi:MAG: iron uptake porin [Cyanobacteria bacterium J06626_23]